MEELDLNPTDNAILDRLREGRATPSYIAEEEGYSRQNITNRLRRLEEHGLVEKIHTGLYELVRDPRDDPPAEEEPRADPPERREEPAGDMELSGADFPGRVDKSEATAAVFRARELIRDRGGASMKEIVREVMPEYPLTYDAEEALEKIDAGERYRGAWWRRVVKPGLKALEDIEQPASGYSEWQYVGES